MVRVGNHIRQMPYHLVIQTPDPHGTLNYRSRVRCHVVGIARSNTDRATAEGGHRLRDRQKVHTSSSALHSIRRQWGSNRACVAAKDTAPDETHQ